MDRICIRPYCNDAATVISGTIHLCGCPGDFGAYCVEHVPYAVCDCVLCGAELACWRIGVVPVALEQWGRIRRLRAAIAERLNPVSGLA
jgi:hypothetical protein